MLNVLDLFSGIGGFSLGLERAGMRTVAFCEIDPYCQAVLRKHWPDVPVFRDATTLRFDRYPDDENEHGGTLYDEAGPRLSQPGTIDLICGGFPCQDISVAGRGAGIEGARSGLWREFARIIGEVRPRYVIVENVAALLGRGIERVLGDLATLGYDAEWHCIPASAVGAPHRRDRVWIVGHANAERCGWRTNNQGQALAERDGTAAASDPANSLGNELRNQSGRRNGQGRTCKPELKHFGWWLTEPDVGRVAHGVPFRVDRLRALGNAIVPQIAEIIGKGIMEDRHALRSKVE